MPSTLGETDTYPPYIDIPSDGEARTLTGLAAAFTALANRTNYLSRRLITFWDVSRGVFQLQWRATTADLLALNPATLGHSVVCIVIDSGLWVFDQYATGPDIPNARLTPPSFAGLPGRWLCVPVKRNVAGAVAALDAAGRLPAALTRFGTVYANGVTPNMFLTGSNVAQVVPGSQMGVEMQVGDLAFMWMNGQLQTVSLAEDIESRTRVVVAQPNGVVTPADALEARLFGAGTGAGSVLSFQYTGMFVATQAGHHEFRLETTLSRSSTATGGWSGGNFFIDVKRP